MHVKRLRIVAAAVLVSFVAALGGPATAAAQSGPIKIGLLTPLTGAFAAIGKDMLNGTELYLDEIGRQAAGRKIELIVEDTEGNTATALTKARAGRRQAAEHGRGHVPGGQPVLEVQPRGVPENAALHARAPAVQGVLS